MRVSPTAQRLLMAYGFPGNIRELRNMVERAIIVGGASDEIRPEHFSFETLGDAPGQFNIGFQHEPTLEEIERRYLEILVAKYAGHRGRIASVLGGSERNIYQPAGAPRVRGREPVKPRQPVRQELGC